MTEYDAERVSALTEDLGKELYRVMPEGAEAVIFYFSQVGRGGGGHAVGYTVDGDRVPTDANMTAFRIARELRTAMYRPQVGTWFSAKITVTRQAAMDATFDYDNEPQWDEGIPDHWFVIDLERFPRDEPAQPAWLKRKLAAAER